MVSPVTFAPGRAKRIAHVHHHDGDCARDVLGSPRRRGRQRNDHVRLEPDQLASERGEPVVLSLCEAVRDDQILPRHPATLSERLLEHLNVNLMLRPSGVALVQEPDPIDLTGLLRLDGEGRGEEAARDSSEEGPPVHHSIT